MHSALTVAKGYRNKGPEKTREKTSSLRILRQALNIRRDTYVQKQGSDDLILD